MIAQLFLIVLACVAKSSFATKPENISTHLLHSQLSPLQLGEKSIKTSGIEQHKVGSKSVNNFGNIFFNVADIGGYHAAGNNLSTDPNLFESLKRKASNSAKKSIYSGIVFQNSPEAPLSDEISGDLNKFEAYSKLLSQLMHRIVNRDLGLKSMQQKIDKTNVDSTTVKFDFIIDSIVGKVWFMSHVT